MVQLPPIDPNEDWLSEAAWDTDPLANKEDSAFARKENLERELHGAKLSVIKNSSIIVIIFLWFFSLIFLFSVGTWFAHFLLPEKYIWLSEVQLSKIQTVIFSGASGAIISGAIQRFFQK
jgi:hypothetical protein